MIELYAFGALTLVVAVIVLLTGDDWWHWIQSLRDGFDREERFVQALVRRIKADRGKQPIEE